jgi:rubrerythrin
MIALAQEEGNTDAVRSFTWANEAEKEHADLYSKALAQLEAGEKLDLPAKYYVCPLCGDTFAEGTEPDKCPLCNFPKAKYIEI